MKVPSLNFFQKKTVEPVQLKDRSLTSRLWVNYKDKVNSLTITHLPVVNTALKISIYICSTFLIVFISSFTLMVDGLFYLANSFKGSLDKLKNKFNKPEDTEKQDPAFYKRPKFIALALFAMTVVGVYYIRNN